MVSQYNPDMRILILLMALASFNSFADTSVQCELVDGLYQNSDVPMNELRFGTLADVFTLNNAKSLNIDLDGKNLRFIRTDILVNKQTRMVYQLKKYDKTLRTVHVMIDRTPKQVADDREFYGNMIIFPEGFLDFTKKFNVPDSLVYNFRCEF